MHVHLAHAHDTSWKCPECDRECSLYDHSRRTRRHLDTRQYQTLPHASLRRTDCPEHGPRVVRVSWGGRVSHFTELFERLAIDWLQEASQQAVARRLMLSGDEIHAIMKLAVGWGLSRRKEARLVGSFCPACCF